MEKRKGFTLIELLVVIAIIALLLAILMPSLKRARNSARAVVCQSNLKQWGLACAMYIEDNDGRFVDFPGSGHFVYLDNLYIYIGYKKLKIRFCPSAVKISDIPYPEINVREKEGSPNNAKFLLEGTIGSAFTSWSWIEVEKLYDGSYGANNVFLSGYNIKLPAPGVRIPLQGRDTYALKGKYNIPVFLDSACPYSIFQWETQSPAPTEEEETHCCINRHNGGVNGLFLDWSVRKVGLKELWKLKWHENFNTNGPWTLAGGVKPEDWPQWMRGFKDY